MKTKVEQFEGRNGAVKNQFILRTPEGMYFQSYNSIIAFIPNKHPHQVSSATPLEWRIKLDSSTWNYSTTTGKYRNQFLNETKKETQSKIDSGEYILTDLN